MPATKPVPRFVPTLTEVVQPGLRSTFPAAIPAIDAEQLVTQAMKLAMPRLEQQLRVSLHALIDQHMRVEAPRMKLELEEAVRVAVTQTIAGARATKK